MIHEKENKRVNTRNKISIIIISITLIFISLMPSISSIPPDPTCLSIIGDYVWEDLNFNGIQEICEPGIDDVTVELYSCCDVLKGTTQTSDGGLYEFHVSSGNYYLKFIPSGDYLFTIQDAGADDQLDSDVDPLTGKTECTNLYSGEHDYSWDAGIYKPVSIGDYVWNDSDQDGIQDQDEQGIDDITVELYSCCDELKSATQTAYGGLYEFFDLEPGNYYVKFYLPEYYEFTQQDVGSDDSIDSDADPITGETICFNLESGMNTDIIDAGMYFLECYNIYINIEGGCGYVTKYPDYPTYPAGSVVQLNAYPNISGFKFDYWSGDLSGSNNPEFITMDSDKFVTAHFTFVEYELIINIDGNGHVIKDPDQETYHFNDFVTLTAIADSGWKFDHWSGDIYSDKNPLRIHIYYVKNITAHFTYHEYDLTITTEGNGNVVKSPDYIKYPFGSIVELKADPAPGWKFNHWSGDITGSNNPEYITIDSDKNVIAHFNEADPPSVPKISGPQQTKAGEENSYTISSNDPYGSNVYYYVDWGDGYLENWFGPFDSGENVLISHTWSDYSIYTIKVKARNEFYSESEWGTFEISVPRIRKIQTNFILNLLDDYLKILPIIKIIIDILR
jgi:hypothetical protein